MLLNDMSRYYANELLNNRKNDIQHWKYVKKIPVGKGYRYFYSWDEYRAYLADPTADLNKSGNKAKQEIKNIGNKASSQIKKTRNKSRKEIESRGKKIVDSMSSRSTKGNVSLSVVRSKNKSRTEDFKKKINEIAKKASEKWEKDKEAVKKSIEKAKNWLPNKLEEYKEERERKKKKEEERKKTIKEQLAKKYKYIAKKTINGKTVYFYSQEELDAWDKKQEYIKNEPDFMKDVKHSDIPYTAEEDAILVNPRFDYGGSDYSNNCAECTTIYELRRRGYDVDSNGMSGNDPEWVKYNTDARYDLFYKDPQINRLPPTKTEADTEKELRNAFKDMPPGSRGDISFKWAGYNAGHSIAWEVDSKGQVHFIDTQVSGHGNKVEYDVKTLARGMDTTTVYKRKNFDASDKTIWNKNDKVSSVRIVRTDNLELKPEVKNICKDSKDPKRKPAKKYKYTNGYSNETSKTMTEKELVTKYTNLYDPSDLESNKKNNGEIIVYEH